MCGGAAWPAGVLLVLVGGSPAHWHRTINCNAKGEKGVAARNYISRQNNFTEKCTMFFRPAGLQRSGSALRRGAREVIPWHGGQTPVGGRFHELNRTLPAHSGSRPPFTTG